MGRPRLNPDHALSNVERERRYRERHKKPPAPKPPKPEPFHPELKTFAELLPEQPPQASAFRSRGADRLIPAFCPMRCRNRHGCNRPASAPSLVAQGLVAACSRGH